MDAIFPEILPADYSDVVEAPRPPKRHVHVDRGRQNAGNVRNSAQADNALPAMPAGDALLRRIQSRSFPEGQSVTLPHISINSSAQPAPLPPPSSATGLWLELDELHHALGKGKGGETPAGLQGRVERLKGLAADMDLRVDSLNVPAPSTAEGFSRVPDPSLSLGASALGMSMRSMVLPMQGREDKGGYASRAVHVQQELSTAALRSSLSAQAALAAEVEGQGVREAAARAETDALRTQIASAQASNTALRNKMAQVLEDVEAARKERDSAREQAALVEGRVGPLQDSVDELLREVSEGKSALSDERSVESRILDVTRHLRQEADESVFALTALRVEATRAVRTCAWYTSRLQHENVKGRNGPALLADEASLPAIQLDLPPRVLRDSVQSLISAMQERHKADESALEGLRRGVTVLKSEASSEIRRLRALLQTAMGTDDRSFALADFAAEPGTSDLDGQFGVASRRLDGQGGYNAGTTGRFGSTLAALLSPELLDFVGLSEESSREGEGGMARTYDGDASVLYKHVLDCEVRIAELRTALAAADKREEAGGLGHGHRGGGERLPARFLAHLPRFKGQSDELTPVELSAAQIATLVANVRAMERSSVLEDVHAAHARLAACGVAGARITQQDSLATAQAEAVSSARESSRLRASLASVERMWTSTRDRLERAEQAAVEREAMAADSMAKVLALDAAREGEIEHLGSQLEAERMARAGDVSAAQADLRLLEDVLADLQGEVEEARAQVERHVAAGKKKEVEHAQAVAESVRAARAAVTESMTTAMDEAVAEATMRARAEAEARGREDKAMALEALEDRLSAQHTAQFGSAMSQAASDARTERESAVRTAVSTCRGEMASIIDAAVEVRKKALEDEHLRVTAEVEGRIGDMARECAAQVAAVRRDCESQVLAIRGECEMRLIEGERQAQGVATAATAMAISERDHADRYRSLAKSELMRRRKLMSRLLELQGNVRVHVRVRPTVEQVARIAAARAGVGARGVEDGPPSRPPMHASAVSQAERDITAEILGEVPTAMPGDAPPCIRVLHEGQISVYAPYGALPDMVSLLARARPDTGLATPRAGTRVAGYGSPEPRRVTAFDYEYDDVAGPYASQESVFESVRPMVDAALAGLNGCVMAYGATGSGKTFTMEGEGDRPGLVVRALEHAFFKARAWAHGAGSVSGPTVGLVLSMSIFEVYRECVIDLLSPPATSHPLHTYGTGTSGPGKDEGADVGLGGGEVFYGSAGLLPPAHGQADAALSYLSYARASGRIGVGAPDGRWAHTLRAESGMQGVGVDPANLQLREGSEGVEIVGLCRCRVHTREEALAQLQAASARRHVGPHAMNDRSSRSHMVVRLWIDAPAPGLEGAMGSRALSVLHFVDLAGSERLGRSHSEGERAKEAASINSSLSVLGSVIAGLRKKASHVPYRDSKLCFGLKDSLSGQSKVLLVACVSGAEADIPETLSTLNFAAKARSTPLGSMPMGMPMGMPKPGQAGEEEDGVSGSLLHMDGASDGASIYEEPVPGPVLKSPEQAKRSSMKARAWSVTVPWTGPSTSAGGTTPVSKQKGQGARLNGSGGIGRISTAMRR